LGIAPASTSWNSFCLTKIGTKSLLMIITS